MDADALEAGPELDALVAQAIGIVHVQLDLSHPDGRLGTAIDPPPYSTDWNAAMEAFDTIDQCLSGHIVREFGQDNSQWYCHVGGSWAYATTGPLAIGRAILQAKEADRDRA